MRIAVAVIEEARTLRENYDRSLADYKASRTAGLTVQGVARIIKKAFGG